MNETMHVLPEHRIDAVAEHFRAGAIDEHTAPVQIDAVDPLAG
jgi:hypothetical protein